MEMSEKQKEAFDKLKSIHAFEYDLSENLSQEILIKMIIENMQTFLKIMDLTESPEISEETRQCLIKDALQLKEKQKLVNSRINRPGQEAHNE